MAHGRQTQWIPEEEEKGPGDRVDVCVVGMGSVKYPLSGYYKEREEVKKEIIDLWLCLLNLLVGYLKIEVD